jgi:uncharacterized protein YbaR (Trm112 family)
MAESPLESLLQCPRCRRAALRALADSLECVGCTSRYPRLDGIPWLFADPARALGDWRNRLAQYLEEFGAASRAAQADLGTVSRPTTRERLTRLIEGYGTQQGLVRTLLAPLGIVPTTQAQAVQQAFATRLPMSQDLHSYYANLHRDWVWGEEENRRSAELVGAALGSGASRVLVLGSGASRLAYDVHQAGAMALTVALDLNPLLLLAARRVVSGEPVELVEFPLAPRALADVAVQRELRAPAPVRAGFEFVFADAWQAPFKAQSFDAVVTPWLVDIVELDFAAIAAHVNRLLAPGGRWVNFGSLAFPWRRAALRLSREELSPVLEETGFRLESLNEAEIPYMRSPASRHSRREEVLVFAATKARRSPQEPAPPALPPWLEAHNLPVPRTPALALAGDASRIQAVLLALIDGTRSIDELVRMVSEQGLLPADQARSAIRGLLERLHLNAEKS